MVSAMLSDLFIFSRRGCDKLCGIWGFSAWSTKRSRPGSRPAHGLQRCRSCARWHHADALLRGIAAHHAGVLPAWKELIEELFQQGLVKVVFATETLAAGINMPARTTVISSLSKRTERGHRPLMGSEFLQMAGRAGRRGLDSQGYVVTVQSRFEGVREAGQLATSPADPLVSQFTPSYGMVLNLLARHDLAKARELEERSFGRYLASLDLVEEEEILTQLRLQLGQLQGTSGDVPWEDFEDYEKRHGRLREERRLLHIQQQAEASQRAHTSQFASIGTWSASGSQLRGGVTPAVIVDKLDGPGQFPYCSASPRRTSGCWCPVRRWSACMPSSAVCRWMVSALRICIGLVSCAMAINRAVVWPWRSPIWPSATT